MNVISVKRAVGARGKRVASPETAPASVSNAVEDTDGTSIIEGVVRTVTERT